MTKNSYYKHKPRTKRTPQLQTVTEERPLTQTKTKKYLRYIFALILGISFYSFEFIPDFSEQYYSAEKEAKNAKNINSIALAKVKDYAKGTEVYNAYLEVNKRKKEVFENYNAVVENEKVFGFKSLHFFWERLGLFLGFFMYALYNLYRSFYFERRNAGNKILHGFIISVCVFYFFWIFQTFQDFSKITYYLITILSAAVVVLAVSLVTKYQDHYINKLKKNIRDLVAFTFVNTRQDKKDEMIETLEKMSKEF